MRIGFVIFPGFQMMSLAAASVFEFANVQSGEALYDIRILSETGGPVRSSTGIIVDSTPLGAARLDTMLVCGGVGIPDASPALLAFIRGSTSAVRRLASICTGAFVLAQAGLLDGRKATTHWLLARELQAGFPGVRVEDDRIFIRDGSIWTSAGMTAGVDLALALLEADQGEELARAVARKLVLYHRRAGGQSQFSTLLELEPKSDRIQHALAYARSHLKAPLSVEELADVANLSPRQFSRAFRSETGQSPAKAVEHLRVEAARVMMEQGRHPVDVVARETGFADRERMRRAFLRAFGQPPQAVRRNARGGMAPSPDAVADSVHSM